MIPLPVTSHVQHFILHQTATTTVESPHIMVEFLPLGVVGRDLIISWISAVYEAKVHS